MMAFAIPDAAERWSYLAAMLVVALLFLYAVRMMRDSTATQRSRSDEQLRATIRILLVALDRGDRNVPGLLEWAADRLVEVHGEDPNVDFVLAMRSKADDLRKSCVVARASLQATGEKGDFL